MFGWLGKIHLLQQTQWKKNYNFLLGNEWCVFTGNEDAKSNEEASDSCWMLGYVNFVCY